MNTYKFEFMLSNIETIIWLDSGHDIGTIRNGPIVAIIGLRLESVGNIFLG